MMAGSRPAALDHTKLKPLCSVIDLNDQPSSCKEVALPIELTEHGWQVFDTSDLPIHL